MSSLFEKELINKIAELKTGKKGDVPGDLPKDKKLTKKDELMEKYLNVQLEWKRIYDKNNYESFQNLFQTNPELLKKDLKKKKIVDLEKEMIKMFAEIQNQPIQENSEKKHYGAEALWQLNVVIVNGMEKLSNIGQSVLEKKGTSKSISLNGITKDVVEREEILKPIFADIYAEYSGDIDKYLTPLSRLTLVYSQMAMNRIAENNAKYSPTIIVRETKEPDKCEPRPPRDSIKKENI
jgi:hypothetical protein